MSDKAIATHESTHAAAPRVTLVLALIVALVGIAGFGGWLAHGDTLFWSMLQAGLAWCM